MAPLPSPFGECIIPCYTMYIVFGESIALYNMLCCLFISSLPFPSPSPPLPCLFFLSLPSLPSPPLPSPPLPSLPLPSPVSCFFPSPPLPSPVSSFSPSLHLPSPPLPPHAGHSQVTAGELCQSGLQRSDALPRPHTLCTGGRRSRRGRRQSMETTPQAAVDQCESSGKCSSVYKILCTCTCTCF